MAETKKIVIEGDVTLAYFTSKRDSRHIVLVEGTSKDSNPEVDSNQHQRLEDKIAQEFNFPNDAEFDTMFAKLDELRSQGLRPAQGLPDTTRDVKLRITVETL